jgi:hypothetical protein
MWTYRQTTGELSHNGRSIGQGYAGIGAGKNNPLAQTIPDVGPLPQGKYHMDGPHSDPERGPFTFHLSPYATNVMFGRAGFLIHADAIHAPGEASHGCIVLERTAREAIAQSTDRELEVIA